VNKDKRKQTKRKPMGRLKEHINGAEKEELNKISENVNEEWKREGKRKQSRMRMTEGG
jgi:hypothetical protein